MPASLVRYVNCVLTVQPWSFSGAGGGHATTTSGGGEQGSAPQEGELDFKSPAALVCGCPSFSRARDGTIPSQSFAAGPRAGTPADEIKDGASIGSSDIVTARCRWRCRRSVAPVIVRGTRRWTLTRSGRSRDGVICAESIYRQC